MKTIPLHQLPDEAYLCALRSMEIYDQLAYSLCSNNTKKVINSLNLRAKEMSFYVSNSIQMAIYFQDSVHMLCHVKNGYYFLDDQIIAPRGIEVFVSEGAEGDPVTEWKWSFKNFPLKEWLHHFCEVLHHPRIDSFSFSGDIDEGFIKPVQEVIKDLQIVRLNLSVRSSATFTKKALESFHYYKKLCIDQVPFDNQEVFEMNKVLIQNLEEVSIWENQKIQIDQVLSSNCEKVELMHSTLTREEFRIFVKLWICGSNPKMNYFSVCRRLIPTQLNPPFDEKLFFKGIKYKKIPMDSEEVYRKKGNRNFYYEIKLAGGFRIRRFDGTNAVVMIYKRMFRLIVV